MNLRLSIPHHPRARRHSAREAAAAVDVAVQMLQNVTVGRGGTVRAAHILPLGVHGLDLPLTLARPVFYTHYVYASAVKRLAADDL